MAEKYGLDFFDEKYFFKIYSYKNPTHVPKNTHTYTCDITSGRESP